MRKDLNKQLCERERTGHRSKYRAVRRANLEISEETTLKQQGMKRPYGYNTKDLNENLNPLWGQVRKAVGRPWDKFYSELCKNFDKRSVINQHILDHLNDFLVKSVYVRDGELWIAPKYGPPHPLKQSHVEYYVDPRDGIIKKNKFRVTYRQAHKARQEREKKLELEKTRWIDEYHVLRKIEGVWYLFELEDLPPATITYEKPSNQDIFVVGVKQKTWEQLSEFERQFHGVQKIKGTRKRDVFTNEIIYHDKSITWKKPHQKYHAKKSTASHALLKKMGIIKE
jgi:hypothetical protein